MVISLLTFKTVLLLSVWVLFAALLSSFGFLAIPLLSLLPLAGLVLIHRGFWEPTTLRMLSWMLYAIVCFTIFQGVASTVRLYVVPGPSVTPPWLWAALSSSGGSLLALLLGAAAGLRWPDRLLVPVLGPQAHQVLRGSFNLVAICVLSYSGGLLMALGGSWIYWLPWPDLPLPVLFWTTLDNLKDLVTNLLIGSSLVVLFMEWGVLKRDFTPQLRRVIIGGLAGLIGLMALLAVFGALADLVIRSLTPRNDIGFLDIVRLANILLGSAAAMGWLAVALGVWAGLRWPDRLLLPARVSGGTEKTRLVKNVVAGGVYVAMGLVTYWGISLGIFFLVWN